MLAASFGWKRWEKPGGGTGGGRKAEERERRVPRQIWQMVSRLPSLKRRPGARGNAAAPLPPNSRGSRLFRFTSSLASRSSFPRLQPHFPSFFFFFIKHISPVSLLTTAARTFPGSTLRSCPSLRLPEKTRAQPWAKQRRKTCWRGFSSLYEPPLSRTPTARQGQF